jgi:hypothetical protein
MAGTRSTSAIWHGHAAQVPYGRDTQHKCHMAGKRSTSAIWQGHAAQVPYGRDTQHKCHMAGTRSTHACSCQCGWFLLLLISTQCERLNRLHRLHIHNLYTHCPPLSECLIVAHNAHLGPAPFKSCTTTQATQAHMSVPVWLLFLLNKHTMHIPGPHYTVCEIVDLSCNSTVLPRPAALRNLCVLYVCVCGVYVCRQTYTDTLHYTDSVAYKCEIDRCQLHACIRTCTYIRIHIQIHTYGLTRFDTLLSHLTVHMYAYIHTQCASSTLIISLIYYISATRGEQCANTAR